MAYLPNAPATPGRFVTAATNNVTQAANALTSATITGACQLSELFLGNSDSVGYWVHIYDKSSTPVPGTDTPIQSFPLPGNVNFTGNNVVPPNGINIVNGLWFGVTLDATASGSAPLSAAAKAVINYGFRQ